MKLDAFIKNLDDVSSGYAFAKIKEQVAEGGLSLIANGFSTETDPYGQKWKYVKYHTGHDSTLQDTSTLKNAWRTFVLGTGVKYFNDTIYAAKQNYTRNMIPVESKGLPTPWRSMVSRSFSKVMRDILKVSS